MSKGIYINDSIHGLIGLSEYEKQIISSVGFNRLHDVYQNSTVYLTYPSNRTKRFEHSIGTMKLCSDMFYYSLENATRENIDSFYDFFQKELEAVIEDIGKRIGEYEFLAETPKMIPKVDMDSFRMSLTPRNVPVEKENIHVILMESVRVAALLHDIGHPPFSHVVERAMKASYELSKSKEGARWKQYREGMQTYFEGDNRALHEVMGDEITRTILKEIAQKSSENRKCGNEGLFRVIILECVLRIFNDKSTKGFQSLHRIIDGSVDGDRLDYVTRDPVNSGLNNGVIDYNRIILEMQMIMHPEKGAVFCFPFKAVNAIEDFLKRRYDLYKKVIFHHRVIKTDYLLEHSVKSLIDSHLEREKDDLSDNSFIPFDISGLWYPLGAATIKEKGNALSQWNDSWLMTVLKKVYFTDYYNHNDKPGTRNDIIECQLAELLRHEKHYYSLIKRNEDFKIIDQAVRDSILREQSKLRLRMDNLNDVSQAADDRLAMEANNPNRAVVDIKGTLGVVTDLLGEIEQEKVGYFIPFILGRKKLIGIIDFEKQVNQIAEDQCRRIFPKAYDIISVFKAISIGTDNYSVYFYGADTSICTLEDISGISASLRQENIFRPSFYLYAYIDEESSVINSNKNRLQNAIGNEIGRLVVERLVSLLDNLENSIKEVKIV